MSERPRDDVKKKRAEETSDLPEASPQPAPNGEEERNRPSPLDMLFREAEVIAHNLKESGTRR